MPNFTIGGIDVEAEPTFKGFHTKAKEGLRAEEARLSFDVEANPVLAAGFQRQLRERIAKATESIKFDVEATPALMKGFQARLRELVDKSSGAVSIDIEARPVLAKGFKADLRAMVDRGAAGVSVDIEARPALAKGFRKELTALVDSASAGGAGKVTVGVELAKDFKAKLVSKVRAESVGVNVEIPVVPKFEGNEFRKKLFTYLDVITAGTKVEVPVVPKIDDLPAFKARLKTLIDLAGAGLSIEVQIKPVLGPKFAAEAAAATKAAEAGLSVKAGRSGGAGSTLGRTVSNDLGKVGDVAKKGASGTLSVFEGTLGRVIGLAKVATVGVGLLGVGILGVGAAGVKSAADLELQERSLQILLQSQKKGRDLFKGIQQVAVSTPFEVPDLTPIARQLLVIRTTLGDKNFGLDRVLPSVSTITDLGAALGATGPQIGRVGMALSKIAGRGKVTSEELRSLSKNLPGFSAIQAIADKLGVSVPDAFKKVSEGAVDSKTAIDGILEGMKNFPGAAGAAAKQAQTTFKGALSNFPDIARNTFYDAFRSELPALTKVIGPNGDLVKAMESALPVIAKAFTPIATSLLQLVQGLVPALDATVNAVLPLILSVVNAIGSFAPSFEAMGKALGVVLAPIAKFIVGLAASTNEVLAPAITAAAGGFKTLGDGFMRLFSGIGEAVQILAPVIGTLAALGGGLLDAIGPVIPVIAKALVPAIKVLAPVMTELAVAIGAVVIHLAPLLTVAGKVAAVIGNALIKAISQIDFDPLVSSVGGLVEAFGQLFVALAPIIPAFVTIVSNIARSMTPVMQALTPLIAGLLTVLLPVLEALANLAPLFLLVYTLAKVVAGVKLIGTAIGQVTKGLDALQTGTFKALNGLSAGLGDKVWSGLVTGAAVAGSAVAGYMAGMAKDVVGQLTSIASAGVGVFIAFKQGGPYAAAIAGVAAAAGFFFGMAKRKADEAKAAMKEYRASVDEMRAAFDTAGIDRYSSAQAKAAAVSELLVKDLKGTGPVADNANAAFKNMGISFSTVATSLGRGKEGIRDLNTEVARAASALSRDIASGSSIGIEKFGKNTAIAKESLAQLTTSLGRAALGGNDQSGLFIGVKNTEDLVKKLHEAGDGTATLANVTERYQKLLEKNLMASPAAQYVLTLGPKTQEAITLQTELARVQQLAADEQERSSGAGTRFSTAYDKVAGSLDKSTTAYKNWIAVQRGGTVDLANVSLGVIDYAKQLKELNANTEMSPYEKSNKQLVLLSQAQDNASSAVSRFVGESGGRYDVFTMKITNLKDQIRDGLVQSLGIGKDKAQELVDTVFKLPTEKEFKVLADTGQAVSGLTDVNQRIQDYILANPDNKILLDSLDPEQKFTVVAQLIEDYKKSDPKAAVFLETLDATTKAGLIKGLLDGIDGTVASAQVDIKVNVLQSIIDDARRPGTGPSGEIAAQKARDELRRRGLLPPALAVGGIVKNPLYALIGEAGPEVVLPLTDAARMSELLQQLGIDATAAAAIAATLSGASSPVAPTLARGPVSAGAAAGPAPDATKRADGLVTATTTALAPLGAELEKATGPGLTTWVASVNDQATAVGTAFVTMADSSTATAAALPDRLNLALVPGVTGTADQVGVQAGRVTTAFVTMGAGSTAAVALAGQTINASLVASGQQLAANAAAAGANAVAAMNRELQAGTSTVGATVAQYGTTLAGGLNPVLAAVGARQIPVTKMARGGDVAGPNVRADIVPALLMPGEFVVRRDSVEKFGSAALHALNRGHVPAGWKVPRFAEGGQVTGDVVGLNPAFKSRLGLWSAAVGQPYNVGSGYRSISEQVRLYRRYLAGTPGQAPAAPPGRSMHNFGLASDGNRWRDRNPGAFGLRFPMSYEAWHVEPVEARQWAKSGVQPDGAAGGAGYGIAPLPKPPGIGMNGAVANVATTVMQYAYEKALAWAGSQSMAAPDGSSSLAGVAGASSPAAAVGWITAAIAATGVPGSWLNGLLTIAKRESNFNPSVVNQWDSNAKKGTPSMGLMQTIAPTFRAYALPGHGNILNPVDNAIAAIRYILARYGDITRVQQANPGAKPKGYAQGGVVSREDVVRVAERNKPEAIIPLTNPARARQIAGESGLTAMLRDQLAGGSGPMFAEGAVQVTVAPPDAAAPEAYGASVANRLAPALADALTRALGA